jgi:hypothetical protein
MTQSCRRSVCCIHTCARAAHLQARTAIKLGPCLMYFLTPEVGAASTHHSDDAAPLEGAAAEAAAMHQAALEADRRRALLILQHQAVAASASRQRTGSSDRAEMRWARLLARDLSD